MDRGAWRATVHTCSLYYNLSTCQENATWNNTVTLTILEVSLGLKPDRIN